MKDLYLPSDLREQTPLVHFKATGELKIEGKSYPENPMKFYGPVIDWIKELKNLAPEKITLSVRLDYFNTSTSKLVLYIFKTIENIYLKDQKEVRIIWFYNKGDEDMIESGEDYASLLDCPYEMIEV
jgi:hypothetical protein